MFVSLFSVALVVDSPSDIVSPPPPPAVVATAPVALPGHYTCPEGADNTTVCVRDEAPDPGPNNPSPNYDPALPPSGDVPGQTLGSLAAAYFEMLSSEFCVAKPWVCNDPLF